MCNPDIHRWLAVIGIFVGSAFALVCGSAWAQAPGGYGQYFQKKAISAPYGGVGSNSRYLYDKYFYHRPTVSPYINVFRPDTEVGTSYHAYVRPELQRREASAAATRGYVQQRKLEGRVGDTRVSRHGYVGGTPSAAWTKPLKAPQILIRWLLQPLLWRLEQAVNCMVRHFQPDIPMLCQPARLPTSH